MNKKISINKKIKKKMKKILNNQEKKNIPKVFEINFSKIYKLQC